MCIMRCRDHPPLRAQRAYVNTVEPVGYPETALICGSVKCQKPTLIWLEVDEAHRYQAGERIFRSFTATMTVKAA